MGIGFYQCRYRNSFRIILNNRLTGHNGYLCIGFGNWLVHSFYFRNLPVLPGCTNEIPLTYHYGMLNLFEYPVQIVDIPRPDKLDFRPTGVLIAYGHYLFHRQFAVQGIGRSYIKLIFEHELMAERLSPAPQSIAVEANPFT